MSKMSICGGTKMSKMCYKHTSAHLFLSNLLLNTQICSACSDIQWRGAANVRIDKATAAEHYNLVDQNHRIPHKHCG